MPTSPSSPRPSDSKTESPIHTYHCICSTLLLATPYTLSSLPRRRHHHHLASSSTSSPNIDGGRKGDIILNLPNLTALSTTTSSSSSSSSSTSSGEGQGGAVLPSLILPTLRPPRTGTGAVIIRREDGFEKRRVWRCGRCGVGVGYEVEGYEGGGSDGDTRMEEEAGEGKDVGKERGRVMFLIEGGLVETGELKSSIGTGMGGEGGG